MTAISASKKGKGKKFCNWSRRNYDMYLMLLPALLAIIVFNYLPMYGIQLAFREYRPALGLTGGQFVGLKYFNKFFTSFNCVNLLTNTFSISLSSIIFSFPIPIILAILFNQIRNMRSKKMIQTLVYMPHFISTVVMVGMLNTFLAPNTGLAGHLYRAMGKNAVNLMGMPEYFVPIYVLSNIWQHAGWNSIIYIAALSSIDPQLYDASKIDGASRLQTIFYIDLPSIAPTIIILLVLNMGNVLSVGFEKAFLMQNDLNLSASEVISTYVYKIGIQSNQFSYATAINLFNNLVNFTCLVAVNTITRRLNDISLW